MRLFRLFPFFALFAAVAAFGQSSTNVAPTVAGTLLAPPLQVNKPAQEVPLTGLFNDDVQGVVRFGIRFGAVTKTADLGLFQTSKPITTANFLKYVRANRFLNSFFHRSVPGFVVQGGGFFWSTSGAASVPTYGTIQNEYSISNLRGTVAMAKVGGDPNSATSQWFVNLANNSGNLDTQNGGFTVFARVLGTGMAVFDEIATLPRVNAGGVYSELPVFEFSGTTIQKVHTLEVVSVTEFPSNLNYSATSSNPSAVAVSIVNGTTLRLTPGSQAGSSSITVTATDLDGASTNYVLAVNNLPPESAGWSTAPPESGSDVSFAYNAAVTSGLAGDQAAVAWGTKDINPLATAEFNGYAKTVALTNTGSTTLENFSLTLSGAQSNDYFIEGMLPLSLAPGTTYPITIKFRPTQVGLRSATLKVAGGAGGMVAFNLLLSGTGFAQPPTFNPVLSQVAEVPVGHAYTLPDYRGTVVSIAEDGATISSFTQSPAPGTKLVPGVFTVSFAATNQYGAAAFTSLQLSVQAVRAGDAPEQQPTGAFTKAPVPTQGSAGLPAGSYLSTLYTPALSDAGQLAARVLIKADRLTLAGIFTEDVTGASKLVARQNGAAGIEGATFKSFQDPLLSPTGKIAFGATVAGIPATGDTGLWSDLFGPLAPILREGVGVPGLDTIRLKSVVSVELTDEALVALVKLAPQTGVVKANVNDTALVRLSSALVGTKLARTGELFEGSAIKAISTLQPALGSTGQGRWCSGGDTLAKLTLADRRIVAVRISATGTITRLIQTFLPDPALSVKFSLLGMPAIGGDTVAIVSTSSAVRGVTIALNDSALYVGANGGALVEVAREGNASPLPGAAKWLKFYDPVANDQGAVVFLSTHRLGTGVNPNGTTLWQWSGPGLLTPIARAGDPAADANGDLLPNAKWAAISQYVLPDGDGAGAIFTATLTGTGAAGGKNVGLWAADSTGLVRLLLRTGDPIPYTSGNRIVASFTVLNSLPGAYSARRAYNATGSLAVLVTYKDRTQGLVRLNIP